MIPYETIEEKLEAYRLSKAFTTLQLADDLGISYNTIARRKRGTLISMKSYAKIQEKIENIDEEKLKLYRKVQKDLQKFDRK